MPSPPYNLRAQDSAQAQVRKSQNLQYLLVCPGNSRSECSTPQNRQIRDERRSIDGKTIKFIHLQNVGLGHPGSSNTGLVLDYQSADRKALKEKGIYIIVFKKY